MGDEDDIDKKPQVSCMTGIFQLFHRHRILSFTTGFRRLCNNKRIINSSNSTTTIPEYDDNYKEKLSTDPSCSSTQTESASHSFSSIQAPLPSSESLDHSLGWNTCLNPPQQTPNMEKVISKEGEELAMAGSTKCLGLQPRWANPEYRKREAASLVLSDNSINNIRQQFSSVCKKDRRASSVDYKEMTRKSFDQKLKEAPRFSLDSKLNDQNGHRRACSGNVVAKLMGLDEIIKPTSGNPEATAMSKLMQKTIMPQYSTNPNDRLGPQMHPVMSHNQEVGMDSFYKDLDFLIKQTNPQNSISVQKLIDQHTQARLIRPFRNNILPLIPVNHATQFFARNIKGKVVVSKEPSRLRRMSNTADLRGMVNECSSIRTGKGRSASSITMKSPGQKLHSQGAIKSHTHFAESGRSTETKKSSQDLNHSPYNSAMITRSLPSLSSTSESYSSRKWQGSSNISRELSNSTFARRCLTNNNCSQSRNTKGLKKSAVVMMKVKRETRGTNHCKRSLLNSQGTAVSTSLSDKSCLSKEHVKIRHRSVCSLQYTERLLPCRNTEDATIEDSTNILMDFPTCSAQKNQSVTADEKTSDITTELKEQVEISKEQTSCTKGTLRVNGDFQQKMNPQREAENAKHLRPISVLKLSFSSNENDEFSASHHDLHKSGAKIINPIESNNILLGHQDCAYIHLKDNKQLHSGNLESKQNIKHQELYFVGGINFIAAAGLSEVLNIWMNKPFQILDGEYNPCRIELHPPNSIFSDQELLERGYQNSGADPDNWHWNLLSDTVGEILRFRLHQHIVRKLHKLFSFNFRIGINTEESSLMQERLLKEVLEELESLQYYCMDSEEELIYGTSNQLDLIQKDIAHPKNQWNEYDEEWVEASMEIECLIMDDLIHGNIRDLVIQWKPCI